MKVLISPETMAVSFILLLLFVFNGADGAHIIGGRDAPPHSRPYMVSLQVRGQHFCGGALVREDFVVTAAHCGVQRYTVVAGVDSFTSNEPTRQEFGVARLIPHPQYDPDRFRNDIMLIQLNNRARLTRAVQLISLKPDRVNAGSRCLAAGWGDIDNGNTSPRRLQEVNVTIVSGQECSRRWGQGTITNAMLCSEGRRAFQGPYFGDSGGPLVCDGATAGVVSFGREIGDPPAPAVYTRISSFRQWITSVINNS